LQPVMSAKFHIFNAPKQWLGRFDKKVFVIYSEKTHTEYLIDIDEVIKLKDDIEVQVSSKVKRYIDSILEPSHKGC